MQSESVIVVVSGGCVSDVLGVPENQYEVFDWDNFRDDPQSYVEYSGGLESEYFQTIKDLAPVMFDEIKGAYDDAVAKAEAELRKDPFWDVPAA